MAIAGEIAIKGSPNTQFNFTSNTTEPVANTITVKVPMSSAQRIFLFLLLSNLFFSRRNRRNFCNKFLYPFFYFNFSFKIL